MRQMKPVEPAELLEYSFINPKTAHAFGSPEEMIAVGLRPSSSRIAWWNPSRPSSSRSRRVQMLCGVSWFSARPSRETVDSPMSFEAFSLSRSRTITF